MSPFSCVIIGETKLPLSCATALLKAGHRIEGMVSRDPTVHAWAAKNHVPFAEPAALLNFASGLSFDYLFSIVNFTVISPAVLGLPRRGAINYHDALLPRYAGMYATSWAIMNREIFHGITWHVMVPELDAGDILKQVEIPIGDRETAGSLNLQCYFAAARSFAELIKELASGTERSATQSLSGRTYFPARQRPSGGGLIAWSQDAESIDAYVRALDYGEAENAFATAKISADGEIFIVRPSQLSSDMSTAPPGTLLSVDGDRLAVSTNTVNLELRVVGGLGQANLRPGVQFAEGDQTKLADEYSLVAKHERFWVDRLRTLNWISSARPGLQPSELQLATQEMRDDEHVDVPLRTNRPFTAQHFSEIVPMRIRKGSDLDHEIQATRARMTFPLDVFHRYPSLRGQAYLPTED
jgi:methionyl-tRNA formyltransferase